MAQPQTAGKPEPALLEQLKSIDTASERPQNHVQIVKILQDVADKIGDIKIDSYFRAGRAYLTITHRMGKTGDLFFKSALDRMLVQKPHITNRQNHLCVIFRI